MYETRKRTYSLRGNQIFIYLCMYVYIYDINVVLFSIPDEKATPNEFFTAFYRVL